MPQDELPIPEQTASRTTFAELTAELGALHARRGDLVSAMRGVVDEARERRGTKTALALTLKTITPVYGGGTRAGQVDMLVPFRPRAIRNGIRHWWWLLHRHDPEYRPAPDASADERLTKKQALYDDMAAIWGAAARPGERLAARISVGVDEVSNVATAPFAAYKITGEPGRLRLQDNQSVPWSYALFGARGERDPRANLDADWNGGPWIPNRDAKTFAACFDNPGAKALASLGRVFKEERSPSGAITRKSPHWLILPGAAFRLSLSWDAGLSEVQVAQVRLALAFWLTFGGVGARTARGLGRLRFDPRQFDAWTIVEGRATDAGSGMNLVGAPRLTHAHDPERSVLWLLEAYQKFRQSRPPGTPRPGRSHWHKAEVVRRAAMGRGYKYTGHRTPKPAPFTKDWLPELLFGAPVIVSFQHADDPRGTFELTLGESVESGGAVLNRYASPLLFGARELISPQGEVTWQPCALYLHALKDLSRRKLCAIVKEPGPKGATLKRLEPGQWWADFAKEQVAMTEEFGTFSKRRGIASMVAFFLEQIKAGKSAP